MDILEWLYELSKALFGALAEAVTEYPLATVLVFIGVFYFIQWKGLLKLYNEDESTIKRTFSFQEILYVLLGFIVAVILSNFVGFLFFAVSKIIEWVLRGFGVLFGAGQALTSPFSADPVAYTIFLVLGASLGLLHVAWKASGKCEVRAHSES
jgi:hypothetical protein